MNAYPIIVALALALTLCESKALSQEDSLISRDEQTNNWPKILGLKQFEDFLRLLQQQIFQVNNQLLKLVDFAPSALERESGDSSNSSLLVQQIQQNLQNLQKALVSLSQTFTNLFGGQTSPVIPNIPNIDIPFITTLQEMVALLQKRIASFANNLQKALSGGNQNSATYLQDSQGIPIIGSIPRVPILNELREYVELFQKQLSRFADVLTRVIRINPNANNIPKSSSEEVSDEETEDSEEETEESESESDKKLRLKSKPKILKFKN